MIKGVVLAGGRSLRMGGVDKSFVKLNGRTIISYVIENAKKQVANQNLIISSNSSDEDYKQFGLDTISDYVKGYKGPLSGIYSAMRWFNEVTNIDREFDKNKCWLVCFACDSPFFPENLIKIMEDEIINGDYDVLLPSYMGKYHPTFAAYNFSLMNDIKIIMDNEKNLSLMNFIKDNSYKIIEFDVLSHDPFLNINNKDDLKRASEIISNRS